MKITIPDSGLVLLNNFGASVAQNQLVFCSDDVGREDNKKHHKSYLTLAFSILVLLFVPFEARESVPVDWKSGHPWK